MAASVVGTQKCAVLEVVDTARFTNVVFEDLTVDGTGDLVFATSGNVSVTSTNVYANAIPSVTVVATNGVRVYGQEQDVEVVAGTITSINVASAASVVLGVRNVVNPNALVTDAVVEVAVTAGAELQLGFFGTAPAPQPTGVSAAAVADLSGTWDADAQSNLVACITAIRTALNDLGLTTVEL